MMKTTMVIQDTLNDNVVVNRNEDHICFDENVCRQLKKTWRRNSFSKGFQIYNGDKS